MTVSAAAFREGLYREHIEEASFLYLQREVLQHDPAVSWLQLHDFEERLEAHLDALVLGGELARAVCRERALEGDSGELFAAVSVLCRHRDTVAFAAVRQGVDFADTAKARAFADALCFELPQAWQPACEQAISRGDAAVVPFLALAGAFRGWPMGEVLARRLLAEPATMTPATLDALSRFALSQPALQVFRYGVDHAHPLVRQASWRALMRAGQRNGWEEVVQASAATEDWPQVVLGLCGGRAAADILRRRLESGNATPATIDALAVLGDLSTVRALCEALENADLQQHAARALHWITGARLYQKVFVAEALDERELLEDELNAWRQHGTIPKRSDGAAFGVEVQQLSTDPAMWNAWLAEHARRFRSDKRYRLGQWYGAASVLRGLLDPLACFELRRLAAEELVTRFECPIALHTDAHVSVQRIALRQIAQWVATNESRLAQGGWPMP